MGAEPVLVTVPNVELCSVGTWPAASHGPQGWTCTAEDLAAAVAAQGDEHLRSGIVKLGHSQDWADDGQPALGRIQNMRLSDDGQTLIGDLVGVPKWLADILPSAFPSRSIEGAHNVITAAGSRHQFVITGVALLGESAPAVDCLAEVESLFTQPSADLVAAVKAALNETETPMPAPVQASTNMEDVRRAYYDAQPTGSWAWVREVWSDFLIVDDDDAGLWRVPWSEAEDGTVTFGAPSPVKTEYVDDTDRDQQVALLSRRPADRDPDLVVRASTFRSKQRRVAASTDPSDPAPAPAATNPKEAGMSPEQLEKYRTQLGLAEDATEADVEAALDAKLAAPAVDPAAPPPADPAPVENDVPANPAGGEGTVTVDAAQWREVQEKLGQGVAAAKELAGQKRDAYLGDAVKAGKFPPARLEHYRKLYDADEVGARALVDSLAAGLVPIVAAGHDTDAGDTPEDEQLMSELVSLGSNVVKIPTRSA